MQRLLTALVAIPLLSACGTTSVTDELAGESAADDAVDAKADSAAADAYTYFEIRADLRKCASPVCGGFFVDRLNRTSTQCMDGSYRTACYAPALDWSEANLSDSVQGELIDAANQDAVSPGVRAIVRGRLASQTYAGYGNLGRFVVTEAWVAETATVSDGVFAKVALNGIQCIAAPCPSLTEKALNTTRTANISEIDWSEADLTQPETDAFQAELVNGVIIAGSRYYATVNGHSAKGRTATAAYHRLVDPAPSAN